MKTTLLLLITTVAFCSLSAEDTFTVLAADKPAPEYRDKLMLFGQFVGDWEFDGVGQGADGKQGTDKGEIHFSWALQGRAIQDVWIERERSDHAPGIYGTTVRFYDPKIDAWRSTWIDPVYGAVRTFIGRKVGEEIVLESKDDKGRTIHWIFSQIKPDSFHWRGERLIGDKWEIYEEASVHRKK